MSIDSAPLIRSYIWDRCFVLQAESYVVCPRRPYRRLSATVIIANRRPFVLKANRQPPREYQAAIVAPNVLRESIEAVDSDLIIVDAGITSTAYQALKPHLAPDGVRALSEDELRGARASLDAAFARHMSCTEAVRLFRDVVRSISPEPHPAVEHDARIQRVMQLIEDAPFDELSVPMLARQVALSVSRLRSLFRRSLGCSLSQYMRWVNAWRFLASWEEGMKFTRVAHEVGFYDLSHVDRALNELFGMNASVLVGFQYHKCDASD